MPFRGRGVGGGPASVFLALLCVVVTWVRVQWSRPGGGARPARPSVWRRSRAASQVSAPLWASGERRAFEGGVVRARGGGLALTLGDSL